MTAEIGFLFWLGAFLFLVGAAVIYAAFSNTR